MVRTRTAYHSVHEQPDRCQADGGKCKRKGIGLVIFSPVCAQYGAPYPVGIPLAVCEQHYSSLAVAQSMDTAGLIISLERYNV